MNIEHEFDKNVKSKSTSKIFPRVILWEAMIDQCFLYETHIKIYEMCFFLHFFMFLDSFFFLI